MYSLSIVFFPTMPIILFALDSIGTGGTSFAAKLVWPEAKYRPVFFCKPRAKGRTDFLCDAILLLGRLSHDLQCPILLFVDGVGDVSKIVTTTRRKLGETLFGKVVVVATTRRDWSSDFSGDGVLQIAQHISLFLSPTVWCPLNDNSPLTYFKDAAKLYAKKNEFDVDGVNHEWKMSIKKWERDKGYPTYWSLRYKAFIDPKSDLSHATRPWEQVFRVRRNLSSDVQNCLALAALTSHFSSEPLNLSWLTNVKRDALLNAYNNTISGLKQFVEFTKGSPCQFLCPRIVLSTCFRCLYTS